MCEIVDPYTSRSAQVACAASIKTKDYIENRKRGCEVQIEEPYPVGKLKSTRGPIQRNEQIHSQVGVA